MGIIRTTSAAIALTLLAAGPAGAATYFAGDLTRVAADLYEGSGGELINTVSCTVPATATPSVVRIDASTGAVIGLVTFNAGPSCNIAGVYAPYVDALAGTYAAVLTRVDSGYYADTTIEPFWIVRGEPSCPAATATPSFVNLAAAGITYVPPGTTLGTITFSPGAGQQVCNLVGVFGKVDLSTITSYTLTVTKDGPGTGTVASVPAAIDCGATCTADFGPDTVVTLTATPSPGSTFAGWNGACAGSGSCTVTMSNTANVTATFLLEAPSAFSLAVSKAGTGTGSVVSSPGGINCGATCSANFPANGTVTLTATQDTGSTFNGWSGAGCAGTGTCVVTMDAAKNVTATFTLDTPVTFTLTVTRIGTGSGAVTSVPAGINCGATCSFNYSSGQQVTLQAVADAGSSFAGWSGAGCSGTGNCVVTMSAVRSVTATFSNAAPTTFALTVNRSGTGSGSVVSTPAGINCGTTCQANFAARTVVTLSASASAGSTFTGWSGGGCTGTGSCNVSMDAAKSVTATFSVQQFALTVTKSGGGSGLVTSTPSGINCGAACSANFNSGASVALGAAPAAGSFFKGWSGACTGAGACNVTMDAVKSVGAEFKLNTTIPRLVNISTRGQVLTGNDVMIGGFIIGGSVPKTVVVRARGPSLIPFGIPNALANPRMDLYSGQNIIATNDDWGNATNAAAITASGFAPTNALESAIHTTLGPGPYTAVVSGVGNGTGVGIVEVFEVDRPEIPLINISTRGQVLTGNDVMIGGFIIQGDAPQTVYIRARGPSLVPFGIPNALMDPVLQLFNGQTPIASNDDWQASPDQATIQSEGFAPGDSREAVIRITLNPGAYTAIVTGKNGGTGVGIVEVFAR